MAAVTSDQRWGIWVLLGIVAIVAGMVLMRGKWEADAYNEGVKDGIAVEILRNPEYQDCIDRNLDSFLAHELEKHPGIQDVESHDEQVDIALDMASNEGNGPVLLGIEQVCSENAYAAYPDPHKDRW